ncbi:MAG: ROK family protein [bacterium]
MYFLIDIGGTSTRLAISRDGATFDKPESMPTPQNFDEAMARIATLARKLSSRNNIKAVVGVPGPLDQAKTKILGAPNLPGWHNKPLKQKLEQELDVPVFIENDAALAGLGEAAAGAGQDYSIVAYLTISTGVGGTRIVNKKIDLNAIGFEPGHQIIISEQGKILSLEDCVSGTGLKNRYGKPAEQIADPAIWDKVARFLAYGLNNITVHWSPHCIVLGGSVTKSIPFDKLQNYFQQITTIYPQLPVLKPAALGDSAGLAGALAYLTIK